VSYLVTHCAQQCFLLLVVYDRATLSLFCIPPCAHLLACMKPLSCPSTDCVHCVPVLPSCALHVPELWIVPNRAGARSFKVLDANFGKEVSMWPLLVSFDGDTPMQHSASETIGHTGRAACRLCAFRGTWVPTSETARGGATRWLGNDAPVEVRIPAVSALDAVRRALTDVERLQKTPSNAPAGNILQSALSVRDNIPEIANFQRTCQQELDACAQQACAVVQ
jgi:hypothetical protein